MTIPIGKYMHAEHIGCEPEVYAIHARDNSILGHAEWYPRWRGYVFSPEEGIVLSWDCCLELSRFLENCNKAELVCRKDRTTGGSSGGGGFWKVLLIIAGVIAGAAFIERLTRLTTFRCPRCGETVEKNAPACNHCNARLSWGRR